MENENHQIARRFIGAMSAGDIPDDLVTDDFVVWIVGSGEFGKRAYQEGIAKLPVVFREKPEFIITSLTAEEDRVVAEFRLEAQLKNGNLYRNTYLYLFRLRDGKVCHLAEYLDTDAMSKVLVAAMDELGDG